MFVDYMVLLPEDYYNPTILQETVSEPCRDNQEAGLLCRHYSYPRLDNTWPIARGQSAYNEDGSTVDTRTYADHDLLRRLKTDGVMATIDPTNSKVLMDLDVSKAGKYVLVVLYSNPSDEDAPDRSLNDAVKAQVDISGEDTVGEVSLSDCPYSFICRQVITKDDGRIQVYEFDGKTYTAAFEANSISENVTLGLDSLVAVPFDDWSLDLVTPQFVCVLNGAECLPSNYPQPRSEVTTVQVEQDHIERATNLQGDKNLGNLRPKQPLIVILNDTAANVDIRGTVPRPDLYKLILQYNQYSTSAFDLGANIQDTKLYSATARIGYCPSPDGCRTVIRQIDNNMTVFDISKNFLASFTTPPGKSVSLDYLMVVPAVEFSDDLLALQPQSKLTDFINQCATDAFQVSPDSSEFCKKSVFSVTTAYNGQALECKCDRRGSTSYECQSFGGQCPCKPNVIGRTCSACRMGYYGFPDCKPCNCPATAYCEPRTGKCVCPPRVTGDNCTECMPFTFGYDPINGCQECNCNTYGVESRRDPFGRWVTDLSCNTVTGQCACKTNVGGRTCNHCEKSSGLSLIANFAHVMFVVFALNFAPPSKDVVYAKIMWWVPVATNVPQMHLTWKKQIRRLHQVLLLRHH